MSEASHSRWLRGALAALAALPPFTAADDATSGNVCAQQIGDYLARNNGQTVTAIEFRYVERRGGSRSEPRTLTQAVVQVAECPGYHFFEVTGNQYVCELQAHIGSVPNYVIYRSSGDGC